MSDKALKKRLDSEVEKRDTFYEVSYDKPDPILVARRQHDEYAVFACALFSYGNAKNIVKFLDSLDFSMLDASDKMIEESFKNHYYRFQNSRDVIEFFKTLKRLKQLGSLERLFLEGYKQEHNIIEGINGVIKKMRELNSYDSQGYRFLVSKEVTKVKGASTLKRWMMFLRWMVRDDAIDLGMWKGIHKHDLLMPLDTHTFKVSQKLGLLERKTYDLYSVILLSEKLRQFDAEDPIKYDFALYRLGQEKIV